MNEAIVRTWQQTALDARRLVDAGRNSYAPIEQLSSLYRTLSETDRRVVNDLISADLGSGDGGVRYDAMWLIREFKIASTGPALQLLATRLKTSTDVGASFELERVERLLEEIAGRSRS